MSPRPQGDPKWLLTGVIGHQLLQAVELGAGGDVEAATVQLADLVVLHVEPLGVVKVRDGEAVGTCGQDRGAGGGRCAADGCSPWGPAEGWWWGSRIGHAGCCFHPKAEEAKGGGCQVCHLGMGDPCCSSSPGSQEQAQHPHRMC